MRTNFALLVAGIWLSILSPAFPQGAEAIRLVPRVRRLQPLQGLEELSRWFESHRRYDRAWEMTAFALAHDPGKLSLLIRAARLNELLGDLPTARVYARRALDISPRNRRLKALLRRVTLKDSPPSTASTQAEASPAEPKAEEKSPEEASETPPPVSLSKRLSVLGLMKMLQSERISYDLKNPKKPLEKLDLDALREAGLLPKEFQHPELEKISMDGDDLVHDPLGSLSELKESVGDYRRQMANAKIWIEAGKPHEALEDLKKIQKKFGSTLQVRTLMTDALRAISPDRAILETSSQTEATPAEALEKALEFWKSNDRVDARSTLARLRKTWPSSAQATIANRLLQVLNRGMDLNFLYDFYEKKAESLKATAATTSTTASTEVTP